ncbi:unnamed protein product [Zymoseptoria tritici ST99CH_3D7]|uniref:DUF7905 domain-containing protein n=2 Tax=Zymoseptoria tritici TaxID=1047171 RepID=A0A1X7RG36_ZYMT9|nr:unnamed protein product [Zymoseptoria tritici ST99CH_3D7]
MEEDYELANARAWDTSLRDTAPQPENDDGNGWQVASRKKPVAQPSSQQNRQNPPASHPQQPRQAQSAHQRHPITAHSNNCGGPIISAQRPPAYDASRREPGKSANTTGHHQGHAFGQPSGPKPVKKIVPLSIEPENISPAQQSWRRQEPPVDNVRIPADVAVQNATWKSIAVGHGTFMHTSDVKVGIGSGSWTFGIWGEPSAVAATKASIIAYVEETGASEKPSLSRKFAKTVSLTPVLRLRYEKRWQRAVLAERYRQFPPGDISFGAIGNFQWPIEEYRPEEVLGQSLEALDPIRMEHSCYVVKAERGQHVLQVMGDDRGVRHALKALKTTCFQIAARNLEPVRLHLIRWPCNSRGTHVYLETYRDPHVIAPPRMIQQSSRSPRVEGCAAGAADFEIARVSTLLSIERTRGTIENTLGQIAWLQGSVKFRIRLGVFLLTQYKQLQEGDMYELSEYETMTSQSQFKARTTEEMGDLHAEQNALAALQKADDMLTPQDALQHDLSAVAPVFSADFIFQNDAGDLHLAMTWHIAVDSDPNTPELEVGKKQWTRLDVDSGNATKLLDISLTDLQNGSAWSFDLSTEKPVSEDKLPQSLVRFAKSAHISRDALKRQDPMRPFVVYTPHSAMRWMRERTDYRYGIIGTDYTLELSKYQVKDLTPGQEHRLFEPRWSLDVYRTAWDTNLAHNQNLRIGETASWTSDMKEWFPRDIGGPDADAEEDAAGVDGFIQLMKKLERVEALIRGLSEDGVWERSSSAAYSRRTIAPPSALSTRNIYTTSYPQQISIAYHHRTHLAEMRVSTFVLALPALAAAQQQIPLVDQVKGWFAKATESLNAVVSSASESVSVKVPNPVASGAAKVATLKVERIGLDNHNEVIKPDNPSSSTGIETWLVYVHGGNKTCFGMCGSAETAFNESVVLLAASPNPPKLARMDCETDPVLCNAWAISPPQIVHIQLPQPLADQSTPATTVRSIPLNRTTVAATQIAAIHLEDKYLETTPYEGLFHPFDGQLAKLGLNIPFGYLMWGFSLVPSWALMIGISFISRTFMGRKMAGPAPPAAGAPAPAAAQ